MKVLFIIRKLGFGGAERQLIATARYLKESGVDVVVATFYAGGEYANILERSNIRVVNLGKKNKYHIFSFLLNAYRVFKKESPGVIYSYMPVSNLLSAILKLLNRETRVVWGIRTSDFTSSLNNTLSSRISVLLEKRLASIPDKIIFNSNSGKANAVKFGYQNKNMLVIYNGIDSDVYKNDTLSRKEYRKKFDISDGEVLIGFPARLDPMKDHTTFILAALEFIKMNESIKVKFLIIGAGDIEYVQMLHELIPDDFQNKYFIWVGYESDMASLYNALDIVALCSSFGEGFPNVIGEAMACGTLCVATDCGDSKNIINKFGYIIPVKDKCNLAKAWMNSIDDLKDLNYQKNPLQINYINNSYSVEKCGIETMHALLNR